MKMVIGTLSKLSLCHCGSSVLHENIPLGTQYILDLDISGPGTIVCGDCNERIAITVVYTDGKKSGPVSVGYLPLELFTIEANPEQKDDIRFVPFQQRLVTEFKPKL